MKKIWITIIFVSFSSLVFSQSAEKINDMIESDTVSLNDMAYLTATYLQLVENGTSEEESLTALDRYYGFSKISKNAEKLTYKDLAYFCMQVWDIKGGLFYTLTKSPRYAFIELQSKNIIPPTTQSNELVSGYDALCIITLITEYSERVGSINLEEYVHMPKKFHTFSR